MTETANEVLERYQQYDGSFCRDCGDVLARDMAREIETLQERCATLRAQLAGVRQRIENLEPLTVNTREWGQLEVLVQEYVLAALDGAT